MIALEKVVQSRFPAWFEGPRARWSRALLRGVEKLGQLDQINAFLKANAHLRGLAFVEAALAHLQVRHLVDQIERERIPQRGRVVLVANHPSGALDALALLDFVGSIRRDVKIVANDLLSPFEPLQDLVLPVRILGGKPTAESLRAIEQALEQEQCVIVFPAGEVSRLGWQGLRDGVWRSGFVRFAQNAKAPVLPVRIKARNSALFYGASAIYKPLGTALLPREIFARRGARIEFRVGHPLRLDEHAPRSAMFDVRRALERIGRRDEAKPAQGLAIGHESDVRDLLRELASMRILGETPDGKRIYCGSLASDSLLLREVGRLREVSFRAVGEGTGLARDVDAFDTWYDHILLWCPQQLRIAGAYRVALGEKVFRERGVGGFYTHSLFDLDAGTQLRLRQGMELGRSFVAPEFWGTRSLDYLWLGIGAYLRQHPQVRYLFGPVSISAALPVEAREHLVACFAQHRGAIEHTTRARMPFTFSGQVPAYCELDHEANAKLLKANLSRLGTRVPTLFKQYVELCEPGGARFLAFNVDAAFNDAVDGLIEVDLHRVTAKKRERYLEARTAPRAEVAQASMMPMASTESSE